MAKMECFDEETIVRREHVRTWDAEVRALSTYHRDRWEESLLEYTDYETSDDDYKHLEEDYKELISHPECHY